MLKVQSWLVLVLGIVSFSGAHAEQRNPSNQNMMEILTSLEQLESEVRQLRGDVEEMTHELGEVRQRQRELYIDVDRRLRELELSGVRSGSPTSPESPANIAPSKDAGVTSSMGRSSIDKPSDRTTVNTVPSPVASVPDRKEREAYNNAFNLLKEGRYDQSIQAFQGLMKQYPQSGYADNAQYWLGEANYVSRKYKVAVEEFHKVIKYFPTSSKVSGAMLKLGFAYYELEDWKNARQTLQGVLRQYPADTAARLAETRLQRMQSEGH